MARKRRKSAPVSDDDDYTPSFGHDPVYHDPDVPFIPYIARAKSAQIPVGMAKTIFANMAKAKRHDGSPDTRTRKKWKKDKCTTSKNILKKEPTIAWAKNPGIGDVPGIDAPGQCSTKIVKGKRVTTCTIPKGSKYAKVCSGKKKSGGKKKKSGAKKR